MNLARVNFLSTRRLCGCYFLLSLLLLGESLLANDLTAEDPPSHPIEQRAE